MADRNPSKLTKCRIIIVEGSTDATALRPYLRRAIDNDDCGVVYCWTYGDITSDEDVNTSNICRVLMKHVNGCLKRTKLRRSDIVEIVQIIDTDGAYVKDSRIIENERFRYRNIDPRKGNVKHWNKTLLASTNRAKRDNLDFLVDCENIGGIPYRVLFMSSDLEHALHGRANVKAVNEKVELAEEFAMRFNGNLAGFKEFFTDSEFVVPGNFEETWGFIRDPEHETRSLERHTNLGLLFRETLKESSNG